jgi:NSS family neurotransmitter:Na+ symporter
MFGPSTPQREPFSGRGLARLHLGVSMTEQRGNWSSSAGFILAATGSAIGLGNLWKFPFITWENNGGAFVLVYLICIVAVGLPIMMAELLIGRKTQKSAVGALKEAVGPAWGVVGLWGVLCGFILLSYYTVIAGWSLFYFAKTLGWTMGGFPTNLQTGALFGEQSSNAGLQLGLSLAFSIATVSVVYFGVQKGIERIARLFLPILFGILILLLISALGMSGSGEALRFIFRPNFAELEPSGILEALGHSFFTLSLGMGAMITYGSYIERSQSIVKASAIIVVLDTAIALVATVIMFSVIFSVPGLEEEVGKSTVGMLFISLPQLFYTEVPFGAVLGPLFYVLVALAALTSTMSLLEVVASYVIDEHGIDRAKATLMCGSTVFVFTIFAALSFSDVPILSTMHIFGEGTNAKLGWFATADHFVSNWMLPTGGFAITLAAGWFMTRAATEGELGDETAPAWFNYGAWRFFIRFVAPIAVGAIIIAVILGVDFA